MILVKTESGSAYEIDKENKLIRRITGNAPPTNRQGEDGQWKSYWSVGYQEKAPLLIVWELSENFVARSTVTSPVVSIAEIPASA